MINFTHVYKTFSGGVHALKNIKLNIEKGEFVFLTGPSGSGKTTFFKLLSGFDKPSSGSIFVSRYQVDKLSESEIPFYRRKIGMVFQDFKLISDLSVYENVKLPLDIINEQSNLTHKRVMDIIDEVGLRLRKDFLPEKLSGGEKQRVAIARALVHRPELIIADEPTGNLDPEMSEEIMDLFEKANSQGTTVIIATHDLNLVKKRNKKTLKILSGELVEAGV